MRGREGVHFEELYAPSGQWFSVSAYPVEDGLAIFYHDITARRTAEDALWTSERRLRTLFSSAGVGIVEVEGDDRFVAVNDRACEILRRSREALLGMSVHELTWPEDRPLSDTLNGELHAGNRDRVEYDKRYTRGDGTPIWVHVTVSAVRDEDGGCVRSIATIEDISERKRAEEALAAARTSAERANRAKDHFLAVLSHELRMPLTPVLMGVSILQNRDDLNGEVRETLETVRRNVEMEARLIDDLLDLTRIERGKIELRKQRIELRTIIQQAVEVCRPDIEARGLQFGVDFGEPSPYWIEADPARLQQVFWNLLRNAVKFTSQGGCVGVRCRAQGDQVTVEVRDSGIGIDREALPRLFNAFEQAERFITQQFGGLGLGLAISKALVEVHGGSIKGHSEGKGQGATFRVRLPLAAPLCTLCQSGAAESTPGGHLHPLRILLVEDHGITARMLKMALNEEGHEVETAGAVAAAISLVNQQPFDLLISDLGLPDGSGHDLIRQLRSQGYTFPGIALSGYGQEADVQRSYSAGFVAHLIKPTSREQLIEAIAMVTASQAGSLTVSQAGKKQTEK